MSAFAYIMIRCLENHTGFDETTNYYWLYIININNVRQIHEIHHDRLMIAQPTSVHLQK